MECIIEFCSDEYQRRLRLLSQAQSERYETTLENYKKIFLAHYKNIIVKCADGKCSNRTPCQHITKVLKKTKIDKIEAFFDGLIEVYMEWINANSITSINHMEKLLKSYKLLDDNSAEDMMELYFKGRVTSEVLTSWDMFHIPFNKQCHLV